MAAIIFVEGKGTILGYHPTIMFCIAFPYCRESVSDDCIACKKCWVRIPKKHRNELLALTKRFPNTKAHKDKVAYVSQLLHERYKNIAKYNATRSENKQRYTIVGGE
jgi:hypothetical protein